MKKISLLVFSFVLLCSSTLVFSSLRYPTEAEFSKEREIVKKVAPFRAPQRRFLPMPRPSASLKYFKPETKMKSSEDIFAKEKVRKSFLSPWEARTRRLERERRERATQYAQRRKLMLRLSPEEVFPESYQKHRLHQSRRLVPQRPLPKLPGRKNY